MGNIGEKVYTGKHPIPFTPVTYTITIPMKKTMANKKARIIATATSSGWLGSLMQEACKDPLDILIGIAEGIHPLPEIADVIHYVDIVDKNNIKLVVSWRSIPVKLDNLALAIGVHLYQYCSQQKIDLMASDNLSPASNVSVPHPYYSAL
jgi:hypothetical protein